MTKTHCSQGHPVAEFGFLGVTKYRVMGGLVQRECVQRRCRACNRAADKRRRQREAKAVRESRRRLHAM